MFESARAMHGFCSKNLDDYLGIYFFMFSGLTKFQQDSVPI